MLSESDKKKAADWFKGHVPARCPSCQMGTHFDVLDYVVMTPVLTRGNVQIGGPTIPLIGLVCTHCYNIRFFSAVMMGVEKPG
jgi:hypothetical protein